MTRLVLDANILMRAALGRRVRALLAAYGERIEFITTDAAFAEARKHLPRVLQRRHTPVEPFMDYLESLAKVVSTIDYDTYAPLEDLARQRLARRDEEDWPVLATALAFDCPIWTEDTDFFGCGVATWTTDRIELFLEQASS